MDLFSRFLEHVPSIETILSERLEAGIRITELRFESVQGQFAGDGLEPCQVYAVLAKPEPGQAGHTGQLPGMLICHGGKGKAEAAKAAGWARQGYAALAVELPGWADPEQMKSVSRFRGQPYKRNRFTTMPAVTSCGVYDSIAAALGAFQLLSSQPETNRQRIGITGISWGGYLTTFLCGYLQNRVKAGFALYGCGNYEAGTVFAAELNALPDNQRRQWVRCFDAANYTAQMRASFLMYPASNDSFFYPPAVNATFAQIGSPYKWLCYGPQSDHRIDLACGTTDEDGASYLGLEPAYFRCTLAGEEKALPAIAAIPGACAVRWKSHSARLVETWAYGSDDIHRPWPERAWTRLQHAAGTLGQSHEAYFAPMEDAAQWDWFAGATFMLETQEEAAPFHITTAIQRRSCS